MTFFVVVGIKIDWIPMYSGHSGYEILMQGLGLGFEERCIRSYEGGRCGFRESWE